MVQTTFQSDVFKALVLFDQQCKICRNVLTFNCGFKKKKKSTVVLLFLSLKVFLKHFVFKTMVQELNYV